MTRKRRLRSPVSLGVIGGVNTLDRGPAFQAFGLRDPTLDEVIEHNELGFFLGCKHD